MALGAIRALYDHGKKVPSDIAIIGIDNEPAAAYAIPSLSTVSLPIVTLSKDATLCALKLANKETVPVEHRVYQSELVIRESTANKVDSIRSEQQCPPTLMGIVIKTALKQPLESRRR